MLPDFDDKAPTDASDENDPASIIDFGELFSKLSEKISRLSDRAENAFLRVQKRTTLHIRAVSAQIVCAIIAFASFLWIVFEAIHRFSPPELYPDILFGTVVGLFLLTVTGFFIFSNSEKKLRRRSLPSLLSKECWSAAGEAKALGDDLTAAVDDVADKLRGGVDAAKLIAGVLAAGLTGKYLLHAIFGGRAETSDSPKTENARTEEDGKKTHSGMEIFEEVSKEIRHTLITACLPILAAKIAAEFTAPHHVPKENKEEEHTGLKH